jgi:hypothetical protein
LPWLKESEVGPIVSQRQFDRVMGKNINMRW